MGHRKKMKYHEMLGLITALFGVMTAFALTFAYVVFDYMAPPKMLYSMSLTALSFSSISLLLHVQFK